METFSVLLAICAGNSPVTGEFPAQRPVARSIDGSFDLCFKKRLSKQSWGWWFETPLHPLWRHCYVKYDVWAISWNIAIPSPSCQKSTGPVFWQFYPSIGIIAYYVWDSRNHNLNNTHYFRHNVNKLQLTIVTCNLRSRNNEIKIQSEVADMPKFADLMMIMHGNEVIKFQHFELLIDILAQISQKLWRLKHFSYFQIWWRD